MEGFFGLVRKYFTNFKSIELMYDIDL
jgi:hypothetical protein